MSHFCLTAVTSRYLFNTMPIPWNLEIAANYWQGWQFMLLHPGQNVARRIASNLQSISARRDALERELDTLQASAINDEPQPSFRNTYRSLE